MSIVERVGIYGLFMLLIMTIISYLYQNQTIFYISCFILIFSFLLSIIYEDVKS